MEHFVNDEVGYDAWISRHPNGIVLSEKRRGVFMVHMAHCDHIAWFEPRVGTAGQWRYTKGPGKRCFEKRDAALAWITDHAVQTTDCRDCGPGFAPRKGPPVPSSP